jgi:hypothetical protein
MELNLCPKWNKSNKQISFDLPKLKLPKEIRDNLTNLKSVKLNVQDFKFKGGIK